MGRRLYWVHDSPSWMPETKVALRSVEIVRETPHFYILNREEAMRVGCGYRLGKESHGPYFFDAPSAIAATIERYREYAHLARAEVRQWEDKIERALQLQREEVQS